MDETIPVVEVEFDKHGNIFNPAQVQAAVQLLGERQATDLVVFSHGWNNDMADARALYRSFFARLDEVRERSHREALGERRLVGLAVLWPSKKFTDEELIPSGDAASAEPDALDGVLVEQLDALSIDPDRLGDRTPATSRERDAIERAKAQIDALEDDEAAQRNFVEAVRSILPPGGAHADDGSDGLFTRDAVELLRDLSQPVIAPPATGDGGGGALSVDDDAATAAGQAAGLGDLWRGAKAGALRLLNFTTYYKMKERAGLVGRTGVADMLRQVRALHPQLRLHLVGHSFGGRLVTAVANALGPNIAVDSLILLQAAYSHNGLAEKFDGEHDGFFRAVIAEKKVRGPLVITHTKNDKAVGIAYPLASRISHDNAAALLGDANDPYGGMGRNGAQHTPVDANEHTLRPAGGRYHFAPATVYNLVADEFIQDHNDICGDAVAHAALSAIAVT